MYELFTSFLCSCYFYKIEYNNLSITHKIFLLPRFMEASSNRNLIFYSYIWNMESWPLFIVIWIVKANKQMKKRRKYVVSIYGIIECVEIPCTNMGRIWKSWIITINHLLHVLYLYDYYRAYTAWVSACTMSVGASSLVIHTNFIPALMYQRWYIMQKWNSLSFQLATSSI